MKTERTHERYVLTTEIRLNDSRVDLIIKSLKDESNKTKVIIHFDYNGGGVILTTLKLIEAIEKCPRDRRVILVFKGFAISAAAYVLAYFSFYNVTQKNVIVQADGPLCVVYHKPRIPIYKLDIFSNNLYCDVKYTPAVEFVREITASFDEVYQFMVQACYIKRIRIAPHMDSIYNINGDVCVLFKKGVL